MADFMHRNGVDLIIGSHPHVVQPYDISDDGKITLFSLGNFVSNQRTRYRDGGLVVTIDVTVVEQGCGKKLLNRRVDYDLNVTPVWVLLPGYEIIPSDVGADVKMNYDSRFRYNRFMEDVRELLEK